MKNENTSGHNRLNGHISIGTPHLGANLATNVNAAQDLIIGQLNAIAFPGRFNNEVGLIYTFKPVLDLVFSILCVEIFNMIVFDQAINNRGFQDLKTTSDVVTHINNGSYENDIFKSGIYCREDDPILWNTVANAVTYSSLNINISESDMLYLVDLITYWKYVEIVDAMYGYYQAIEMGSAYWASYYYSYAEAQIAALNYFLNFNYYYKTYILQSANSDGVVQEVSQLYPNANTLHLATGVSHPEELAHPNVEIQLREALNEYIQFVETNPPSSPYNVTITNYNSHPRITWEANQEPDFNHYIIERSDGQWETIVTSTTATSYIDQDVDINPVFEDVVQYRIKAVDDYSHVSDPSEIVSISDAVVHKENVTEETVTEVKSYDLMDNYPNPFNPSTTIQYQVPEPTDVTIKIFDSLGKEVRTLVNEHKQPGQYKITFNAGNLPSGIYIYSMQANKYQSTKKMLLVK